MLLQLISLYTVQRMESRLAWSAEICSILIDNNNNTDQHHHQRFHRERDRGKCLPAAKDQPVDVERR